MISQVFVLSSRGDVLLFKDYKNELSHATHEMFYKAISSETPPSAFFNIDGINFVSVKVGGIYFVCTLLDIHTLPSTISSFTAHFTRVVKDYCGTITESSLRNNFVLLYEILDEVIDFGFIQHCTTAKLKHLISNEAIGEGESGGLLDEVLKVKTKGSSAAAKPIAISVEEDRNQKNEVYLDLVEKLVVTIDSEGQVTRADIIGKLVLKSYLKGNPEVQIGLAHNLKVRTRDEINNSDCIVDDINFHPCVNQDSFDNDRSIHFYPSDGETVVLTYRKHESFTPPFKCYVQVEEVGSKMIDVIVKLNPTFPSSSSAVDVALTFKAPRGVDGVSFSMSYDYEDEEAEQSAVFVRQKKQILWKLGKVQGGREQILRAKFNWDEEPKSQNILKEIGSILIDFEVPMYLCSNLKIRYLRIMERSAQYEPERWVRYMSQSESYRFRL